MGNNSVKLFEFGTVVQEEMSFNRFLIKSSGCPRVQWSGTIYASVEKGIMRNIHVKSFVIWTSG